MKTLTKFQSEYLTALYNDEYGDYAGCGRARVGEQSWSWSPADRCSAKNVGGVVASLVKKGFVEFHEGWGMENGYPTDCTSLTEAGFEAMVEAGLASEADTPTDAWTQCRLGKITEAERDERLAKEKAEKEGVEEKAPEEKAPEEKAPVEEAAEEDQIARKAEVGDRVKVNYLNTDREGVVLYVFEKTITVQEDVPPGWSYGPTHTASHETDENNKVGYTVL